MTAKHMGSNIDVPEAHQLPHCGGVIILAATGLHRSEDGGRTFQPCAVGWQEFSRDQRPGILRGFGETNGVTEMPDGTLLCTCFTLRSPIERYDDFHAYLIRSTDRGRTWGDATFIVNTDEVSLLALPGGTLLGFVRQAIASRDLGKTWDLRNFLMLAWASWDNYGGHPRSIRMPDGTIVTGYYARYFKDHPDTINEDIVSHCLRWTPPDGWPPGGAA